jgi:hypothetical protein
MDSALYTLRPVPWQLQHTKHMLFAAEVRHLRKQSQPVRRARARPGAYF